jgi:hypothetical protein
MTLGLFASRRGARGGIARAASPGGGDLVGVRLAVRGTGRGKGENHS